MRRFFIFALLIASLSCSIVYASEVEPPLPDLGASDIVTEIEPFPDDSALSGTDIAPAIDYQADMLTSLEAIYTQLTFVVALFHILIYVILPFGFAFFICWRIGKWSYDVFIIGALDIFQ